MDNVKTFTIDGESFNVARATAIQQDELLSLLSPALVNRLAASNTEDLDPAALVMMFVSMPFETKRKIDSLMLSRVFLTGTESLVTADHFSGRMMAYSTLRAEVMRWNFDDFFTFWANEFRKERSNKIPAKQEAV